MVTDELKGEHFMKKVFSALLICFAILSLIGCGDSSSYATTGQSITLSQDTPVCSSKENVNKMISYVQNNNNDGASEMEKNGEATVLPAGTKVNIVKSGIVTEIETESGEKWFAPNEVIK